MSYGPDIYNGIGLQLRPNSQFLVWANGPATYCLALVIHGYWYMPVILALGRWGQGNIGV